MAELVNAYINWQVCEMGEVPNGNLDDIYPIPPLPRVRPFSIIHHSLISSSTPHPTPPPTRSYLSPHQSSTRAVAGGAHLAPLDPLD
jgi:hypothetical protein